MRLKRSMLPRLEQVMKEDGKSRATQEKYLRDVKKFLDFAGERTKVTRELTASYRQYLLEHYTAVSANSMLAAMNYFLRVMGCQDCAVKAFKIQRESFRARSRELTVEEYYRLLETAREMGKTQIFLVMQTLCSTGIRVSELPYITVQSLQTRRARVTLKGKTRTVILPAKLCQQLLQYVQEREISSGSIFITRNGKPMDRTNILHAMKKLCKHAGVDASKVFPHNLRHLFAVTYYRAEKDVCHLADVLGHSSINTTRIYTMVSSDEQEQQIDGLNLVI